jgi:4-amino-4-deoxy-L-arabinose transferase-like glycosyltransferase
MADRVVLPWWRWSLSRWTEVAVVLSILAVAAWFRLYEVGQAPPGPHYDEAAAALDAIDILNGHHMAFSPRSYGREMLFVYVAAPLVALLGPTRLALRLPIAVVGILTVLATYLLARELSCEDKGQAKWTGMLAALFLALSFWHLALNHLSFRANYLPLFESLCFLFLWRAIRTGHVRDYLLSGIFLGLSLHTYTAARFVPVVLILFFAGLWLTPRGRALARPHWRRWALLPLVAFVVLMPLLIHFAFHPEHLFLRPGAVAIWNPSIHQGDFWALAARSVLGNLALFGWGGDPNWLYNIPGRPGMDAVQAVLFWMGVLLCMARWRQPRYFFLLVWWLIMLLPSILAPDPIPHSLRAIGTVPVACILAARPLVELSSHLPRRFPRLGRVVPVALLVALPAYLGWAGYDTWHSYFRTWLPRDEVYYAYHGHMADLAEQINRDTDTEAVYIFPVNFDRRGETYQENTLELLHHGPVPFRYIAVDDATVVHDLADICAGKRRWHLIVWTHGEHVDADPRHVLPFLLTRSGREVEERAFRGYRIITYERLLPGVDLAEPLDFVDAVANFGGEIRLLAQAHRSRAASGEAAWVALRWQIQQGTGHDYKVSLRLVDARGRLAGLADSWLLSNEHQTTSRWEPGRVVTTYHLLSSLAATLPDRYYLHLILYDPETQSPIWFVDEMGTPLGEQLDLGHVEIDRPWRRDAVEPAIRLEPVQLAPALELLGYDLAPGPYRPAETMYLVLYWQATEEIAHDYAVRLQLVAGGGEVVAEWKQGLAYPTSQWQAGDLWRSGHDLDLAPSTVAGDYELLVGLAGVKAGEGAQAMLGSIEVQEGRRLFAVPDIRYPQVARLGEGIQLLGYDLSSEQMRAGEALHLTLYWQAVTKSDASYTVFAHLLDGNSRIWGQEDNVPGRGALPTTGWMVGEVIVDDYEILLGVDTPSGEYLLEVGMYLASTGQRLPISDERGVVLGDRILLNTPIVVMH